MTKVAAGLRLVIEGRWNKPTEVTLYHTQRDHCEIWDASIGHLQAPSALEVLLAVSVVSVVHHDLTSLWNVYFCIRSLNRQKEASRILESWVGQRKTPQWH